MSTSLACIAGLLLMQSMSAATMNMNWKSNPSMSYLALPQGSKTQVFHLKAAVCNAAVAKWVDDNKKKLSVISSCLLILVPWMQISKAVMSDVAVSPASLLAVLAAGVVLHLVFLAFNITATNALRLGQTGNASGEKAVRVLLLMAKHYGGFETKLEFAFVASSLHLFLLRLVHSMPLDSLAH